MQIGIQLITRLETFHKKGFVHRDIKANNFMIGKKEKIRTIYIIDFGLTKRYKDARSGQHIIRKGGKSLVGTARYASIASHDGFQQGRRDDLESLGYLLIYLARGRLPWQGIQLQDKKQKYAQIGKMKKLQSIEQLCNDIDPSAKTICTYFQNVKSLGFTQEPNYDYLRKIFKDQLIRRNQENAPFDWQYILNKKQNKQWQF